MAPPVVRVAAVGDLHIGTDSVGCFSAAVDQLGDVADVLLLAGDLTRVGSPDEAAVLARELAPVPVPTVAVLGNHDHHSDRPGAVVDALADVGVTVLECATAELEVAGVSVAVVGAKGFGGGFRSGSASDFGEPEMKAFVRHTKDVAGRLGDELARSTAEVRLVLLHYAPIDGTLRGEPPPIHPFLGSYLLGEAIDRTGADLAVHGHAHAGSPRGVTPGGTPVRNVAWPVLRAPFAVVEVAVGAAPLPIELAAAPR